MPFIFIDLFAYKADPSGEYVEHLVSRATQIILATIHGIGFPHHPWLQLPSFVQLMRPLDLVLLTQILPSHGVLE